MTATGALAWWFSKTGTERVLSKELSDAIRVHQKAIAEFKNGKESTLKYELPKIEIADCLLRRLGLETHPRKMNGGSK